LPSTYYDDQRGRSKRVRYWAMRPVGGEVDPRTEVDEARWLAATEAQFGLSYERDRPILRAFGYDGSRPVLIVRHARAGKRKEWTGDDRLRPLDARGVEQAGRLVEVLAGHELERILSSPYLRCVQTVEPLAAARGLELETREELAEGAGAEALLGVLPTGATVLCVHGDVLEEFFGKPLPKGSTTLVEPRNGALVRVATVPLP